MSKNIPTNSASLKLPDYSGAWWSFKHTHTTTMRFGKFTPIKTIEVPGGSMYKCKPSIRFESLPMVSPLYNGYTLQLKYFFIPYRLYVPKLRKNRHLEWNAIPKLPLPSLAISSTLGRSVSSVQDSVAGISISLAGSLLERLKLAYGEFAFGQSFHLPVPARIEERNEIQTLFVMPNIAPLVGYVDAWLTTEFNPQDRLIPVDVDAITPEERIYDRRFIRYDLLRQFVDLFSFGDVDGNALEDVYEYDQQSHRLVLSSPGNASNGVLFGSWPLTSFFSDGTGATLAGQYSQLSGMWSALQNTVSAVGLLPVTYRGDYFSSWFAEDVINSLERYVVNSGESLISLRRKNSEMLLNLIGNISGQKWRDYVEFVYHENLEFADHPILLGSDTYDFGTIDFIANANTGGDPSQASPGSTDVVGGAASKAREYNRQFDMFKVKSKEPGFVMVTASIVPSVVYYQGIPRHLRSREIDDLWHPNYQKMGFQQTLYGELFSVGVTPSIEVDGFELLDEDQNTVSDTNFSSRDQLGLGYVPLGWEFMKRYNDLSGGMLTSSYTTWVNRRDVLRISTLLREGVAPGSDVSTIAVFNPLFNPNEDLLLSTYVDSMLFNDSFANNSRAEAENIIVKFAFDESIYQPVVHQLIDKRI